MNNGICTCIERAVRMAERSMFGLSPRIVAALAYVAGWPAAVGIFLAERRNRFVRFHAAQAIFGLGTLTGLFTAVSWVDVLLARKVPRRVNAAIGMGSGVLLIVMALVRVLLPISALMGRRFALPIFGRPAMRVSQLTGVAGTETPGRTRQAA
jgi:uncharacterized membrane protein